MKPKDLKYPYTFEEREPTLSEGVLFLPPHYLNHDAHKGRFDELFKTSQPLYIEYCSGNGEWILEQAENRPDVTWIAVEKRIDRVQKIWAKMKNRGVGNLIIVCGQAECLTKHYLNDGCIDQIYIHFPDPWPKDRHAKHRLFKDDFVKDMARCMRDGAELRLVTDHQMYGEEAALTLAQNASFSPLFPEPYYVVEEKSEGSSYFHRLWLELGRSIYIVKFQKELHYAADSTRPQCQQPAQLGS
ncbi:MAG: tRNA (guanine-N(7)-)-methyltransferase [Chlamydiia bacterium]|nr:tRNA (guanine-N(7)-)-methyltransferase [Chlamydiia bacterium]